MTDKSFEKAKQIKAELKHLNEILNSIKSVRTSIQLMKGKKEDTLRINAPGWSYSAPSLADIYFNIPLFENLLNSQELFYNIQIEELTKEFKSL